MDEKFCSRMKGNMEVIPNHDVAVLSVDNIDQTNNQGSLKWKHDHGLHINAVQAVLKKVGAAFQRQFRLPSSRNLAHQSIKDPKSFVDGFIPSKDDVDITTYTEMFIAEV